jgi:plastocyanin
VTDRRWTARLVLAGVALTMLAAACGNSSNSSSSGGGGSGSGSTPSASTAGGGGYGSGGSRSNYGGGGGSSNSSGGTSVQTISQANFSFSPATFTVTSGDTITVKNTTSSTQHTFTITGQTVDVTVDPGTSQKVTISLPAGTYPFICRFHVSRGMTGTLTVG